LIDRTCADALLHFLESEFAHKYGVEFVMSALFHRCREGAGDRFGRCCERRATPRGNRNMPFLGIRLVSAARSSGRSDLGGVRS
jgi:hypothetical protein